MQYLYFLKNLVRGEMGRSIVYKMPVLGLIVERIRADALPARYGVVLALTLRCRSPSCGLNAARWPTI